MELQTIIISIILPFIFTIIGIIIGREYNEWRIKRRVNKAELTGDWTATLDRKDKNDIAIDIVKCKHDTETNEVRGEIVRETPEREKNRKWEFSGRFSHNIIYLTFWPHKDSCVGASSGTIVMDYYDTEREFKGQYMKYDKSKKKFVVNDISWKKDI